MPSSNHLKEAVRDYWSRESCGEALYLAGLGHADYVAQAQARYSLEPYILEFANFEKSRGMHVLEIGVGLGADHEQFASAGAIVHGLDLTERAIEHTTRRLQFIGKTSDLRISDAEALPYPDESMDVVYSWGVIHHSPNTDKSVAEIHRVLRKGGIARIMIYHKYSIVGFMLWVRYGLFRLRPLTSMSSIYANYLESPGTKGFSLSEAREMFAAFASVRTHVQITHGDLLTSNAGQRHRGVFLSLARAIWPRWLIRIFFPRYGLFLMVTAKK